MSDAEVRIVSHVEEYQRAKDIIKQRILNAIGAQAVKHAQDITPVETGRLRGSMEYHLVDMNNAVIFGTNIEYGVYIELGTGIYATEGIGRQTPWFYTDKDGNEHITRGSKPHHMIKKAATEHDSEYMQIITSHLKDNDL